MSEQERERIAREPEEADVEGHGIRRGEGEAPPDAGERSEESDEPDVEGHRWR
jgi:hypothetical protein